ncbi:hypothetical protein FA13DRAFT_498862 [Coprinellus micaceus]|uniref:Uncharacterized protein n=1 Tax=Coprinellus micaceus TaxID=71717 RepID=A0A4Y7T9R1_COPMI|nr:hypothetical protein FA13DRAFT_498862 [Coprinellus micaceus]
MALRHHPKIAPIPSFALALSRNHKHSALISPSPSMPTTAQFTFLQGSTGDLHSTISEGAWTKGRSRSALPNESATFVSDPSVKYDLRPTEPPCPRHTALRVTPAALAPEADWQLISDDEGEQHRGDYPGEAPRPRTCPRGRSMS